jgi:hypothetical protein
MRDTRLSSTIKTVLAGVMSHPRRSSLDLRAIIFAYPEAELAAIVASLTALVRVCYTTPAVELSERNFLPKTGAGEGDPLK